MKFCIEYKLSNVEFILGGQQKCKQKLENDDDDDDVMMMLTSQ